MAKKTIVVTGAAGFLGSHLCFHHLMRGDQVFGIDSHVSSMGPNSPHFVRLTQEKNFTFIEGDITNSEPWDQLDDVCLGPDLIYNFACPASPPKYQANPVHTMLTNVQGTYRALNFAKLFNARLVQASTSEVYGDPETSPQSETYRGNVNPYGPRACYDEGKRAAEALCFDYRNQGKVDARVVRIFNTYGPHMDPTDGRVVSNFVCQALRGEPITIYGDGQQTRSFCYVDDLIRAITSMGSIQLNPGTPINIGNPHEFTMLDLAELVQSKVNKHVEIVHLDLPTDDPLQRCPDISLARSVLGWEPLVNLEEGLHPTIEWFRKLV